MGIGREVTTAAGRGAAATAAMTVVMFAIQRADGGRMPPAVVTDGLLDKVARPPREPHRRTAAQTAGHLGFGATSAIAYSGLGRLTLRCWPGGRRVPRPVRGAGYGLVIWAVSYAGWVPVAGILPPPSRDRTGRQIALVLSHLVYGAVLGALTPDPVATEIPLRDGPQA